jgi:predicted hydrocarbon binding protein
MGNLLFNDKPFRSHYNKHNNSLRDPLIDPRDINEQFERNSVIVRDKIDRVQSQCDRLTVESKSCRDDVQKVMTNYGKEIYNLGEICSNLTQDISVLMKNQQVIKDLLTKILEDHEKNGSPPDPSLYSSVNDLGSLRKSRPS